MLGKSEFPLLIEDFQRMWELVELGKAKLLSKKSEWREVHFKA